MTTRVALVGAGGKLGRIIHRVIDATDGFELDRALGSRDTTEAIAGVDLVVDASVYEASERIVREALSRGISSVIATSGWSAERIDAVRPLAEESGTGVLFVPNFSLGSVIGTALATLGGRFFPSVEIVETHRDTKVDSPSGTAVRTAELIAAAREDDVLAPSSEQRARGELVAGIPIHSLRRPGVIARQEAILSGPGESLTILHDTIDPAAAYAPGIRMALAAASSVRGVAVGLDTFLDLGIRSGEERA